jgi:hypothetical protein
MVDGMARMSNTEGERTMASLAADMELAMSGKTQDSRIKASELKLELMDARGHVEMTAKLIPAVLFLLDRYMQEP